MLQCPWPVLYLNKKYICPRVVLKFPVIQLSQDMHVTYDGLNNTHFYPLMIIAKEISQLA